MKLGKVTHNWTIKKCESIFIVFKGWHLDPYWPITPIKIAYRLVTA